MKCSFCSKRAVYYEKHFGKAFCKAHLEHFLIKKLKREVYKHRLVEPNKSYLFFSNFSPASEAALYLFSKLVENWPVELFAVSINSFENVKAWNGEKIDFVVDPVTLEGEVKRGVFSLVSGKVYLGFYKFGKVIKPFRKFGEKELCVLALVKKLNFREGERCSLLSYFGKAENLNFLKSLDLISSLLLQQKNRK